MSSEVKIIINCKEYSVMGIERMCDLLEKAGQDDYNHYDLVKIWPNRKTYKRPFSLIDLEDGDEFKVAWGFGSRIPEETYLKMKREAAA